MTVTGDATDLRHARRALLGGLDAAQREAVTSNASPLAIIAAAGSGKTMVLTRRIARRVLDGSADPRHVLALTFTRDAASELRRRIRRLDISEPIQAGTFHSVALSLLRDRALANHSTPPQLAPDRVRLLRECLTELRIQVEPYLAGTDIDWARARMIDPDSYERASRAARRRSAVPTARFPELLAAYQRLKKRRGVLDFDDLLANTLQALRTDASFREAAHWRFRHLFVDEAQDLNPLQHQLLEAWRGPGADLCLVGDPRQAIYGWNGADPVNLTEVEARYPGVTVIALTGNYRCSPQVVRAGTAALASVGQLDDTESRRPDGPSVSTRAFADDSAEAVEVANQVHSLVPHLGASNIAVLARTNDQLTALQRALDELDVPTERSRGRSPLDVAIAEAYRAHTRERLATWVETIFAERAGTERGAEQDPMRRRVAEEADRFLTSGEFGTFRAWVEARTPFDDVEPPADEGAVALLTFHAAKGREWPAVFVTGVEAGLVPHSSAVSSDQVAEEGRLLYVALTRASSRLIVTHAAIRRNAPAAPSPWLAAVEATTEADRPAPPPVVRARAAPDPMVPMRAWRSGVARAAGVADVAVCSDRVLRSLLDDPPETTPALAERLGISVTAAQRLTLPPSLR